MYDYDFGFDVSSFADSFYRNVESEVGELSNKDLSSMKTWAEIFNNDDEE